MFRPIHYLSAILFLFGQRRVFSMLRPPTMSYLTDTKYIQKNLASFPEISYSEFIKRVNSHQDIERIYVTPSLNTIVSERDSMYEIVHVDPSIMNSVVDLSQKQDVDTVFMQQVIPTPNPIISVAGEIYGFASSFLIPAIVVYLFFSIIGSIAIRSSGGSPGMKGAGNPFMPPGLNGMSDFGNTEDLKLRLKRENVSLASFAGSPEIFDECVEVVSYLKNATNYEQAGAELPRGILLEGPPGTGKTLLAKAIASEADSSFISVSASEFVEMYVGVGAQKVRDLFSTARENTPCIIFIDEIDSVGKQRGGGISPGNDEREQTLNQILAEMDGFSDNKGILVIAATNRKDVLDPALLRPGRFDRIIRVPSPDKTSREKILQIHARNKNLSRDVDLGKLAENTQGFTGAQLKNVLNEAAIYAAREGRVTISKDDLRDSLEKLLVGIIRKKDIRQPKTRERVAIHESGHAILTQVFSPVFELKKVSIQSTYNGAGGYTIFSERSNVTDSGLFTKDVLFKRLIITMGGKAAEAIHYGDKHVSVGATQDLQQANDIARRMVHQFGFGSDEFETYYEKEEMLQPISEYTKSRTEKQIQSLVYSAFQQAKRILSERLPELHNMTDLLLKDKIIVY